MPTDITLNKDKDIQLSGFTFTSTSVIPIGNPNFNQWNEAWIFANKAETSCNWWIGDLLNLGLTNYPEEVQQLLDGYAYQSKKDFQWVCKQIPPSRRREAIPFSVHREIAPFKPDEQEVLLDKAEKTGATVQQIRKEKHRMLLEEKRPVTKLDDKLILGNALRELLTIPNQSIDCVITDPPYGIDYQSNRREVKERLDKIQGDKDEAFELLNNVCEILKNKVKPNSHLYFFTSWKVYSKFEAVISRYFDISNVLVWDKLNHGTGDLEGNYAEQYELIIFANTGRRILNGDRPTNIIQYSRVANNIHPTEKPVGLIERLIEISTNEGECVLDPFMGAGSTCKAAKNKNRNYWGIEIDKQWFDEAQRKING